MNEEKMDSMISQEEDETPPVMTMSVTTTVSKTSEFEWKLSRLPSDFTAVEVIKFETGGVDETVCVDIQYLFS
jgi:hypothetical protein